MTAEKADELTRKHTAFASHTELVRAGIDGYVPTLHNKKLADFFDAAMRAARSPTRAFRVRSTNKIKKRAYSKKRRRYGRPHSSLRKTFRQAVIESPPGDVLSIPALRKRLPDMSKESFDHEILKMANDDEVALFLHDLPMSLSKEERDSLVRHPDNTYFIGISPRRKK